MGNGNKQIGFFHVGLFEDTDGGRRTFEGYYIGNSGNMAEHFRIGINHRYIVILLGQHGCKMRSYLTCPNNDYIHDTLKRGFSAYFTAAK